MSKFYGVNNIGQTFLINQLEQNMKSYLDNGFLKAGGFVNIHKPVKNIHSNGLYKLYTVNDANFKTGQIWQPARKDWVFETGVNESFHAPLAISGVYINNVFHNINTTGNYAYTVDYKNSRIVFAKKQATSLNVEMSLIRNVIETNNKIRSSYKDKTDREEDQNISFRSNKKE